LKLNRTPSLYDRQWRNEENENWQDIEKALSNFSDLDEVAKDYIATLTRIASAKVEYEKLDFEIGTVSSTSMDDSTQERNDRLRSPAFELSAGDIINPTFNEAYEYSLMLEQDGEYIGGWGMGWFTFGKMYEVPENYLARVVIRRAGEGGDFTQDDINAVERDFRISKMKPIVNDVIHPEFEYGGWWAPTGDKVTGSSPYQIRNTTPYAVKEGMTIETLPNETYIYKVLLFKGEQSLDWGPNINFGESYTFDGNYTARITVERKDQATMTEEDLSAIREHFGTIELNLSKYLSSLGVKSKGGSHFDIVGEIQPVITGEITDHFSSPNSVSSQEVHNRFISLVGQNEDVASYQRLGTDAYSYNMYKYESLPNILKDGGSEWLQPPRGNDGTPIHPPKIILTSGIHGRERSGSFVLYQFMYHLFENPSNNPVFDTLRDNIHFVFIPICSPSGFNDNTYENRAGMNINRDFPPYGNVTQSESQLIKNVIDANADADYHIDFHNFRVWDYNDDIFGYALTDDPELKRLTTSTYKYVGRKWQESNGGLPQNRRYMWGYTADANIGTVAKYTTDVLEIPGTIIETPMYLNLLNETQSNIHSALVTQLGVDLLTNLIISIVEARK